MRYVIDHARTFSMWVAALACVTGLAAAAEAEPAKIRLGIGAAVEEQVWLLVAKPELAPNQGKSCVIEHNRFPAAERLCALERATDRGGAW